MRLNTFEGVLNTLNSIYRIDKTLTGDKFIKALIEELSKCLDYKYIFFSRPKQSDIGKVLKTDFFWAQDRFVENIEYDLKNTPCENVMTGNRVCVFPSNVFDKFPDDLFLKELNVQAYLGAPVIAANGDLLGLLVVMDTKEFVNPESLQAIMEFLANRISAELAREEAYLSLKRMNVELERRVEEKTRVIQKAQEAMLEQEKLASLGRVVAGIAHEIRNPLNLILNSEVVASAALDELKNAFQNESLSLSEHEKDSLGSIGFAHKLIATHGQRIEKIINVMLEQSRSAKQEFRRVDLKALIDESANFAYQASNLKSADIELDLIKEFPPKPVYLDLSSDIQSLFVNVFENSMSALDSAHGRKRERAQLKITLRDKKSEVVVEICDNGVGIPKENQKLVFEPFFTTKDPQKGTGLGLSLVKAIVDKNSGRVELDSKIGEYTRFSFTFPRGGVNHE